MIRLWRRLFCHNSTAFPVITDMSVTNRTDYGTWTKEDLVRRIHELEQERSKTSNNLADISNDKKRKTEEERLTDNKDDIHKKIAKKSSKTFDFSKHNTRFIALKFAYLGWNYNGLAVQKEPTPLPTVEGKILEAMNRCKIIPSPIPQECNFSRCGRTDKGVSAMNQVISLTVRSSLTDIEQMDSANDCKEIPYVHILNQLLPHDICISAVCLRPPSKFDARFSCKYRHYRYIFHKSEFNISKISEAASKFVGEHDFRNFCKIDGAKQITNYSRRIISSKILQLSDDFYCFDLIGSAFLWHQVRCMTAILFLIGQELEDPDLINKMLDTEDISRKPIYDMASDIPLLLYDCAFPEMEWITQQSDNYKTSKFSLSVESLTLDYQLKAAIAGIFKSVLPISSIEATDKTRINLGDGKGKVTGDYQKILNRNRMESVEFINNRFLKLKEQKTTRTV